MCTSPLLLVRDPALLRTVVQQRRLPVREQDLVERNSRKYIFNRDIVDQLCDRLGDQDVFIRLFSVLPCGSCLECRVTRREEWSRRMQQEALFHPAGSCWFLTLTFAPGNEPGGSWITFDPEHCSGDDVRKIEIYGRLSKEFFSSWMKRFRERVRSRYGCSIRFFACGEYGPSGHRMHYHVCIFGLPLDPRELVFFKRSSSGLLFTWSFLSECWSYGFSSVAAFSAATANYVAGYVAKKLTGRRRAEYEQFCFDNGVEPEPAEFVLMSRRPGLGTAFVEQFGDQIRATGLEACNGVSRSPSRFADYRLGKNESWSDSVRRRAFKARRSVRIRSASERSIMSARLQRRLDHLAKGNLDDF